MATTRCISGKCGVQNHIVGSAEHAKCLQGVAPKSGPSQSISSPPPLSDGNDDYTFARDYLQSNLEVRQKDFAEFRQKFDALTPTQKIQKWVNKRMGKEWKTLNRTPDQERALKDYLYKKHDGKIQNSFARFMNEAKKQPSTESQGHNVEPFGSLQSADGIRYDSLNYYHEEGQEPIILATETAVREDGGEPTTQYLRIRFEIEGPVVDQIDPLSSERMDSQGYNHQDLSEDAVERDFHQRRMNSMLGLLEHVQNENNHTS